MNPWLRRETLKLLVATVYWHNDTKNVAQGLNRHDDTMTHTELTCFGEFEAIEIQTKKSEIYHDSRF